VVAVVPVVPVLSILLVLPLLPVLLSRSGGGGPAGASGICRLGTAAIRLLVLLPGSTRVLPIREELPWRMDEGGTTDNSTSAVAGCC
jgi:hypothetical protein